MDGNLLVRGAALAPWETTVGSGSFDRWGPPVDVRITGGEITALSPALEQEPGEMVLEVPGGLLLPGLHDHHLHLRALVAAGRSAPVGPADVAGPAGLANALRHASTDRHGWKRAVGYHESVAGELDRWSLDTIDSSSPVRVQHRSGILWVLNSAGIDAVGLDDLDVPGVERDESGRPTGRLLRMDGWLASRLPDDDPVTELGAVSRRLAALGVTGVTDATPDATTAGISALVDALSDGRLLQRLHVMCPHHVEMPTHPLVTRGPHKVMLDDDWLPPLDDLVETAGLAHGAGGAVAVHCVTVAQLVLTVTALQEAGTVPGDRIEHGSVVPPDLVAVIARLGVTVVTNPGLVHERGDSYLQDVEAADVAHLYPCASLLAAGVPVAGGTDAPFGAPDPWAAISAAQTRRSRRGQLVAGHEAVPAGVAVGLFTGHASFPGRQRRLAVGEPGDLCVLAGGNLPGPGQLPDVAATVVGGRVVHRSG